MKNPRKTIGFTTTDTVVAVGIKISQEEHDDYPFSAMLNTGPQETLSPEEEAFRALLRDNLPRHEAPQALRDRIQRSIMNMPD
ncbi:MAG: hypothetical protein ABMA02_08510 [Saprospiraceae bacterium]